MSNVIHLPRPLDSRPAGAAAGLYFRVGRNQHKDVLDVLSGGVRDFHGIVLDATSADRHADLHLQALELGLDVVLDPKTHAMAFPGGHTNSMASLPWGVDRPHNVADFEGDRGALIANEIAEFAAERKYTQVLGPCHVLSGANDRWLRHDINMMGQTRAALDARSPRMQLIYPLSLPMGVFRDSVERSAIVAALADAPMDALWLRVDNFGSDATGEKTVAYIHAARELQALGVPIVADYVGGLSALGLLAFGSVGGVSHGVTFLEGFKASGWRRPPQPGRPRSGHATRVYVPGLDMLLKPEDASQFLTSSTRTRGKFGCRNSHCCPSGPVDMLNHPARHFIYQRSDEVARVTAPPTAVRGSQYLDQFVRPISDDVSAASGLGAISEEMRAKLKKKQKTLGRFRQSIGHLLEAGSTGADAVTPKTRKERGAK